MFVTVCAESCVGGDAILIEDTKGTEGLVARITIARVWILSLEMMRGMYVRTRRKQMYERSSTIRGLRDPARCCDVG